MRFHGKVCLVTGGGSGIGRAACERFAREGGRVAVLDIDDGGATETVEAIRQAAGEAFFIRTDVGRPRDIRHAIDTVANRWQHLDIIVNDAARMTFSPILELDDDEWDSVIQVNLRSVFIACKYGVPHMRPGGAIVNISSVHAHETTKNVVPYATSKGGLEAFTRGFSEEMAARRIRVNAVAPGAVNTPMLWTNPNVKSGAEKVPRAIGEPEDIAAAICFLASDEARFITGTTLVVDGGRLDLL